MGQKATAVVAMVSLLFWTWGCATPQKIVQYPAGQYETQRPAASQAVRVRALLTTAGEKIEFPGDRLAFVVEDYVTSFGEDAELITANRDDTTFTRHGGEIVSIQWQGREYEPALIVAETGESVTFVVGDSASRREIPLSEIDQLWVPESKGLSSGSKVVLWVLVGAVVLFGLAVLGASRDK